MIPRAAAPDDEAFLRAIADAPWDDAPRLVYADWLDELGDPRGQFLRAEVELFHALGTNPGLPAAAAVLRERAGGIDPVWVARVGRPPVGVCADRLLFADRGPPVSGPDVRVFEVRTGVALPADYRAFLLNTDGGRAGVAGSDSTQGEFVFHPLAALPGLAAGRERYLDGWERRTGRKLDPRDRAWFLQFLDVGTYPDGVHRVRVGVAGPAFGRVHAFDPTAGFWPGYPSGDRPVADSFATFLAALPGSGPYPL